MNERGHLSAETIDLLMLSSLAPEQSEQARNHISACQTCKARWSELEEDKARFEQFVFPRTISRVEERLRAGSWLDRLFQKWRLLVPVVGVAAAALVAIVALGPIAGNQTEDEAYVGIKGAAAGSLEVVANRPGAGQFPVKPGSVLKPGDRIRFVVDPGAAKFLLIASRDGQGQVTVYYPYDGKQSAAVKPGKQELADSIELDAVAGKERLLAVFSEAPLDAEAVKTALAQPGEPKVPGAKSQVSWEFEKVP